MSFTTDNDRTIKVYVNRDAILENVQTDAKRFLNAHPGMEILQINNEMSVSGNKIIHCCWIYYRAADVQTDENTTKRI